MLKLSSNHHSLLCLRFLLSIKIVCSSNPSLKMRHRNYIRLGTASSIIVSSNVIIKPFGVYQRTCGSNKLVSNTECTTLILRTESRSS